MSDLFGFQSWLCTFAYWFINITGLFIPCIFLCIKFESLEPFDMFLFSYWHSC